MKLDCNIIYQHRASHSQSTADRRRSRFYALGKSHKEDKTEECFLLLAAGGRCSMLPMLVILPTSSNKKYFYSQSPAISLASRSKRSSSNFGLLKFFISIRLQRFWPRNHTSHSLADILNCRVLSLRNCMRWLPIYLRW